MPYFSTHMHFGKILSEKAGNRIDKVSYLIGLAAPSTIADDDIEEYHILDEDGNVDVREFYEKFMSKKLSLKAKSFVLGYYSNLWLEEYYKFNASKLIIHNNEDLTDEELEKALSDTFKYYDSLAVGNYFDGIDEAIKNYVIETKLDELEYIKLDDVKALLADYFAQSAPSSYHLSLVDRDEYVDFIANSCEKFLNSL